MVKRKGNKKKSQPRKGVAQKRNSTYPDLPPPKKQHYSLRDEAFNTGRQRSAWSASLKLRYKTINFVSGGYLAGHLSDDGGQEDHEDGDDEGGQGTDDDNDGDDGEEVIEEKIEVIRGFTQDVADSPDEEGAVRASTSEITHITATQTEHRVHTSAKLTHASAEMLADLSVLPTTSATFSLEEVEGRMASVQSQSTTARTSKMDVIASEKPLSDESSSSEEVLFYGRDRSKTSPVNAISHDLVHRSRPDNATSRLQLNYTSEHDSPYITGLSHERPAVSSKLVVTPHSSARGQSGRKSRRKQAATPLADTDEEERLALEDYMANLEAQLDEESTDKISKMNSFSLRNLALDDGLDGDPRDLEVEEAFDPEEDLRLFFESSNSAQEEDSRSSVSGETSGMDSASLELGVPKYNGENMLQDLKRHKHMIEEELLSAIMEAEGEETFPDSRLSHRHGRRKQLRLHKDLHLDDVSSDDSLVADIMQQDPDNLYQLVGHDYPWRNPRTNQFYDEDPEDDEAAMNAAAEWHSAHKTSRLTKAERRNLREQGLADPRKRNKPAMSAGFTNVDTFMDQFSQFLKSERETLQLGPMAIKDRKLMHELGLAFGLKTKSVGGRQSRAPVLIKTKRTSTFDKGTYLNIARNFKMDRFAGLDRRTRRGGRQMASKSLGGATSGLSYRDGEVVGAGAEEIGAGNKGRAMLEKLGWKQGMALGAEGSNGILTPITHTVKIGKAALG